MLLPLNFDLQGLAVEAAALADLARHPDVGEEVHLQLRSNRSPRTPRSGRRLTLKLKRPEAVAADLRLRGAARRGCGSQVEDLPV